jgi:hypothetical protein
MKRWDRNCTVTYKSFKQNGATVPFQLEPFGAKQVESLFKDIHEERVGRLGGSCGEAVEEYLLVDLTARAA